MERGTVLLYLLNGAVCRTKWAEEEGKKLLLRMRAYM